MKSIMVIGMVIGVLAVAAGACLESQGKTAQCGEGQSFAFGGEGYCIYSAAIIIEGFACPPDLPFRHDAQRDGLVVCSATEGEPTGGWDDLIDAWQQQNPDADASDTSEVEVGPRSACESALAELGVGDIVNGASDSGCTLARHCSDGVVAACDHGALACDCLYGELRCVEITGEACPPHEVSLLGDCLPGLGEQACNEGLVCTDGKCQPSAPICDATACFSDEDCDGACAGESAATGQLGRCVSARERAGHDCWDPNDCPGAWVCNNALQPCAPCTSCVDYQIAGQCTPVEAIDPAMGLIPGVGRAPIVVVWAYDYAFIDCETLRIEVRDEVTGDWNAGPVDPSCVEPFQVDFASATPHALPAVTPTAGFDYAWVRASATMLRGCGLSPDTCSGTPITLTTPPLLLR